MQREKKSQNKHRPLHPKIWNLVGKKRKQKYKTQNILTFIYFIDIIYLFFFVNKTCHNAQYLTKYAFNEYRLCITKIGQRKCLKKNYLNTFSAFNSTKGIINILIPNT